MKKLVTLLLVLTSLNLFGQDSSLIGKKSPELDFAKMLNYSNVSAKLSDFSGKVVIIDFWATWCSPCIKGFTHLEELQKEFVEELQVITVTDEKEERINRFIENFSISLPIALDSSRQLGKSFPHRVIPHTVLIDKKGVVRAVTFPNNITKEVINKLVSGEVISLEEKKEVIGFNPSKPLSGSENVNFQVTFLPYQQGIPGFHSTGAGRIVVTNSLPQKFYEIAYGFPSQIRTVIEIADTTAMTWEKHNRYCFEMIIPAELSDRRFEIMKQQLAIYFDEYKAEVKKEMMKVKVLKVIEGRTVALKKADRVESVSSSSSQGLSMINAPSSTISDFLQSQLSEIVCDGTGLEGLYDIELKWYEEDPGNIHKELEILGLELVEEEKEIELLVISDK
ncbi:redoxin domain-containing protein [Flammeovirgaceae bacterium SG7u.111]|nr:redoxin domain-containing protein [Flammeovirgaceae bacterium SG7u.132]WPO34050.1 redoxin domain-containing protein [Flammeovirgaceae bacterium SG7u.111]